MTQDINMTQVINDNILYINDNILYIIDYIFSIYWIYCQSQSLSSKIETVLILYYLHHFVMSCNAQCVHGTVHTVRDTVYFAHRIAYSIRQLSFVTTKPFLMILYLYYTLAFSSTVHCTVYSVHYTLYTKHCTLYTVHCTLYNVHCYPCCTLYSVQCTT